MMQDECGEGCASIQLVEHRIGTIEKQLCVLTKTLLGDRSDPDSMRKSVFGMVERWNNWLDLTVRSVKFIGGALVALGAATGIAKAAGWF